MKKLRLIVAVTLVTLVAFMVVGCKPEDDTRSAKECMTQFSDAVNAGAWGDLKDCTYSEATNYNLMSSEDWENEFNIGSGAFSFTMIGNNATATKDGISYTFTLVEDGKDYYTISRITKNGGTTPVFE